MSLRARPPRRPPLRYACWYWNRPFRLTAGVQHELQAAHVERLYVYAGTVVEQGEALRLVRAQQWETRVPCALYAVFRVHPAANDRLLAPSGLSQATTLLRQAGLPRTVRGIQWDADIDRKS